MGHENKNHANNDDTEKLFLFLGTRYKPQIELFTTVFKLGSDLKKLLAAKINHT